MERLNIPKVLECSSEGDKRYSALFAKVSVFDKEDTIENHYQMCKRFSNYVPKNWYDAKGRKPTHIVINGISLDARFLTPFYKLLWVKYLDANPDLVEHAKTFDFFHDKFKGQSINCQADIIKQYVKDGRDSIMKDKNVIELCNSLRGVKK